MPGAGAVHYITNRLTHRSKLVLERFLFASDLLVSHCHQHRQLAGGLTRRNNGRKS
jgi:hypothetical protein